MVKASTMLGHCGAIKCVDFDPSDDKFATAGADGVIGIWDANHIICSKTLCWFKDQIEGVSFSHDGKVVASYTDTMKIDVTHIKSGTSVFEMPTGYRVTAISWHPETYLLAIAGLSRRTRPFYNDLHQCSVVQTFSVGQTSETSSAPPETPVELE
ncbi:WD40 domain containing protein [Trichuris trichiura]|uniref:WD40 domain containing protein n=1 Tax=Trichuris trichiura TaxID=36087 RepID=A0A077ZK38_TRITR|nr:WD40 domain containing protein [Trichuris trichiura]